MTADHLSNRRNFLATAGAGALGALVARPRALEAKPGKGAREQEKKAEKIVPTADAVIVLWMAGGMAHTETFDPKRYTPYAAGIKPGDVWSTFPQIDSAVDEI